MPVHIFASFAFGALQALGGTELIFIALVTHRHDRLSLHGD
jgi:hypothetical protein